MKLNELRDNDGARKSRMRVGRGIGSGKGKTAGRGQKGQKSREGVSIAGFEGGQMPLHMRLPKRGFKNIFAKDYAEVNIGRIQEYVDLGRLPTDQIIDHAVLRAAGLARGGRDGVRILGKGSIHAGVQLIVAGVSKPAQEAISRAGGSVEVIARPVPAERAALKHGIVRAHAIARRTDLQREADSARLEAEATARPTAVDLSMSELVALRARLAAGTGPDPEARTLSAILAAAAFVAVPQELRSMASNAASPDKRNERAILERAVLVDLHRHLLSGDETAARAASLALARAAVRDDPRLSSLAASRDIKPAIRHELARALAHLLFQAGDRYYSTFKLTMLEPIADGINVAGEYSLSRRLPVSPWANEAVVLPAEKDGGVGPVEEYQLYSTLEGAAPVITAEQTRAADTAALFASRFSFKVPKQPLEHPFRLVFVVRNVHVESFEVRPEEVRPN